MKLIGKTILNNIGWNEKSSINIHSSSESIETLKNHEFWLLKKELDDLQKDPAQIDFYLKTHGLDQVKDLKKYILNNDISKDKVNELFQAQNITNTAKQATGYNGVKNAINLYNQSLTENEDGTKSASDSTKNLISALTETNPKLAECMEKAKSSSIGIKDYAGSLVTATAKTVAFNAVTSIMNAGISFVVSSAFSAICSTIDKLAHLEEETAEKAQQLGEEFKNTQSDINGYKEQISSLHKVINDSTSSIEDVADARRSLMSIQDEMIKKFGTEKGVIDSVTAAINGQAASLDNLTQTEWLKTKNEFNSYDLSMEESKKYGLTGSLYFRNKAAGNSERMLEKYGEQTVTFDWGTYGDSQKLTNQIVAELENAGINITEKQEKQTKKAGKGAAVGGIAQALDNSIYVLNHNSWQYNILVDMFS